LGRVGKNRIENGLKIGILCTKTWKLKNLMLFVHDFDQNFVVFDVVKIVPRFERNVSRFCHTRNLKNAFFFIPNVPKLVLKGRDFILTINGCFYHRNEGRWWIFKNVFKMRRICEILENEVTLWNENSVNVFPRW